MNLSNLFPLYSYLIATAIAQIVKPFLNYRKLKKLDWRLAYASGGFPSSHSAGVTSLFMSVGLQEGFDSTLFAIALALGIIVIYDAANVRYYAGKNIALTKQIISDLKEEASISLDEPIYEEKIKEVLGHTWPEVLSGILLGIAVSLVLFYIRGN